MNSIVHVVLGMVLIALSSAANAVTVTLVSHNQTSGSGTISSLITDGTAYFSSQTATTAIWNWDGTTLTSTGIYNAVGTIGSSPYGASILEDSIVDLSISSATSTATGTSYACLEGTFLSSVSASGCGGYQFGSKAMDESTTTWGPGLAFDRTIGGNDILTGPQRSISAYDFDTFDVAAGNLEVGNGIALGVTAPGGGELMTFIIESAVAPDFPPSVRANETLNIDVLANDDLLDNIADLTTTTPGTTTVMGVPGPQAGVSIDFKSAIGFSGDASFDYTVTDSSGNAGLTATVTVTVTNLLPDAVDDAPSVDGDAVTPVATDINVMTNDTLGDTGPNPHGVTITVPPTNGTIGTITGCDAIATCAVPYTPGAGFFGTDTFTYQLQDGNGDTDTAVVTVSVVSSSIPSAVDDNIRTDKAVPLGFNPLTNDAGLAAVPLSIGFTQGLNGVVTETIACTAQGTCELTYTPNTVPMDFVGDDSYTYTITDTTGKFSTATVNVFVNDLPVAVDDPANILPEPLPAVPTDLDVQANDTGLNDVPITVTVIDQPAHGGTAINAGMVTYTSDPGYNGTDTFTYELTDSLGIGPADTSNEATVDIIVNDIPVANDNGTLAAPAYVIPEGTTLSLDILANDTGLSDIDLTVTILTPPANGSTATPTGSPGVAGAIAIDYVAGTTLGVDFFEYQIMDNSTDISSAMVFVTVTDPDIPMAFDDAAQTVVDVPVSTNVLANDTGLADEPLLVTITMPPGDGTLGTFMPACDTQVACLIPYIPDAGFIGVDTYQYLVTDDTGDVSNIATVTITVTDQPVAVDDADTINAGQTSMVNVLANDSGLSDTPLVVTVTTPPTNGSIGAITACNGLPVADCRVSYTPNAGFVGDDTYQYTVTDVDGDNATATVTITVLNNDPVAVDDSTTTNTDTPVTVSIIENDTGFGSPVIVHLFTNPQNGTAVVNNPASVNPTITYTPNPEFSGTEIFEYVIDDGAWTDIATVTIKVILDADNDGVDDSIDNCLGAANSDQIDADGDGYGNWCDADFTNDGVVNFGDLAALRTNFASSDPVTDLNNDQRVNFADLARFRALFGKPPGPSGQVP